MISRTHTLENILVGAAFKNTASLAIVWGRGNTKSWEHQDWLTAALLTVLMPNRHVCSLVTIQFLREYKAMYLLSSNYIVSRLNFSRNGYGNSHFSTLGNKQMLKWEYLHTLLSEKRTHKYCAYKCCTPSLPQIHLKEFEKV